MHRPIGVTLLAIGAGVAGLWQIWRTLVFLGIAKFNFVGQEVSVPNPQWGYAIWALILAAIWFWVAMGFWNVRGYAWSFGIFISLFTVIFGFFALLGNNTGSMESEFVGWLLAFAIFMYLNYPGVRNVFVEHEMSLLTPEQRAAMEKLAAANAAAAAVMNAPTPPPAPPAAPPAPPANPGAPTS